MERAPGNLEKARKVHLEPGFSLPHWMKLSMDADLSGGVGKADPDDEGSWKAWPIAEIRKHNSRDDFWTVIRGKVYNLTPYLRFHPGGIDILDKTAGNDGTVLFDKYHKWVNVEALLEACFIGVVAAKKDDSDGEEEADEAEPIAAASTSPSARVVWDEANLAANDLERGVAYGTMKVDQAETPFLYYEDGQGEKGADDPNVAIHSNFLPSEHVAKAEAERPGPRQMNVEELQKMLGLLETDEKGVAIIEKPKYTATADADFEAKRQAIYAGEAQKAAASVGLPEGWAACLSTSEPREIFYVHLATNSTQWERPDATTAATVTEDAEATDTEGEGAVALD
mmetsp:Transcript_31543/g.82454  ORF Transcript_31543/g.82454 Transcript_31543/m.82454 type:complete len:340 (+) Transcript_31543:80-1099(+)